MFLFYALCVAVLILLRYKYLSLPAENNFAFTRLVSTGLRQEYLFEKLARICGRDTDKAVLRFRALQLLADGVSLVCGMCILSVVSLTAAVVFGIGYAIYTSKEDMSAWYCNPEHFMAALTMLSLALLSCGNTFWPLPLVFVPLFKISGLSIATMGYAMVWFYPSNLVACVALSFFTGYLLFDVFKMKLGLGLYRAANTAKFNSTLNAFGGVLLMLTPIIAGLTSFFFAPVPAILVPCSLFLAVILLDMVVQGDYSPGHIKLVLPVACLLAAAGAVYSPAIPLALLICTVFVRGMLWGTEYFIGLKVVRDAGVEVAKYTFPGAKSIMWSWHPQIYNYSGTVPASMKFTYCSPLYLDMQSPGWQDELTKLISGPDAVDVIGVFAPGFPFNLIGMADYAPVKIPAGDGSAFLFIRKRPMAEAPSEVKHG